MNNNYSIKYRFRVGFNKKLILQVTEKFFDSDLDERIRWRDARIEDGIKFISKIEEELGK